MKAKILIRRTYDVESMFCGTLDEPAVFTDAVTRTTVEFSRPEEQSDASRYRIRAIATLGRKVNDRLGEAFLDLWKGRMPLDSRNGRTGRLLSVVDAGGLYSPSHVPDRSQLPERVADFLDNADRDLIAGAKRIIHLASWRLGGSFLRIDEGSDWQQWSLDGENWRALPGHWPANVETIPQLDLSEQGKSELTMLLDSGVAEPLHYELFGEAWALRESAPRSAIVIGMSALETAVKQVIAERIEGSRWLMENIPSPPLYEIIRDYLPTLQIDEWPVTVSRSVPPNLLALVRKGTNIRNGIVHRGATPPSQEDVQEILDGIQDLLALVDAYSGHQWALNFLSRATLRDVTLPTPST